MHLLGFFSLACSLLAAALLPGTRDAPAAAAAFESGLGFSDAEPDADEAQVGARPRAPGLDWGRLRGRCGVRDPVDPGAAQSVCCCFTFWTLQPKLTELAARFLGEKFSSCFLHKVVTE